MKTVDIREAETTLSTLLAEVEQGEQIVITRNGRPIVRLTRIAPTRRRQPGLLRALPAWRDFTFDPSVFAPMMDAELEAEGWPAQPLRDPARWGLAARSTASKTHRRKR
jgi:prevent-host-death family protein